MVETDEAVDLFASCPCDTTRSYGECCGRFLERGRRAVTAEELMRSRFSAYRRGRVGYLVDTTHPGRRSAALRREIEETLKQIEWVSLRILSTRLGGADDKVGKVEFVADYRMKGGLATHHEHSRFRRHQGEWTYLDDAG